MEDYEAKSAFDMGISTLGRINYWLYQVNEYAFNDQPHDYYKALNRIYSELYPFIIKKQDRIIFHKNIIKDIERELHRYIRLSSKKIHPPREVFDRLAEWDRELRADLKKVGLYMREGQDISEAML